jgi:phenylacetic acid degradation operon negative regulatory protein
MSHTFVALEQLIAAHHARVPPRTGSLIVTVFGAVALPSAEPIRLSDLQDWLSALGIEAGLVRTALSRLVADGTLLRDRDGKAALYRLSATATRDFEQAADVIFGRRLPHPTGFLHLALIEEGAERAKVRAALARQGFVALAANLMLKPEWTAHAPDLPPGCLLVRAEASVDLASRAATLWPLAQLHEGYGAVSRHATALSHEIDHLSADKAFLARLLLVHEFRRIVLRDPFLPPSLLPADWAGRAARSDFDRAIAALDARMQGRLPQRDCLLQK